MFLHSPFTLIISNPPVWYPNSALLPCPGPSLPGREELHRHARSSTWSWITLAWQDRDGGVPFIILGQWINMYTESTGQGKGFVGGHREGKWEGRLAGFYIAHFKGMVRHLFGAWQCSGER